MTIRLMTHLATIPWTPEVDRSFSKALALPSSGAVLLCTTAPFSRPSCWMCLSRSASQQRMEAAERQKSLEKHMLAQQYVPQSQALDSGLDDLKAMKAKARAEDLLDVLTPDADEVCCRALHEPVVARARARLR